MKRLIAILVCGFGVSYGFIPSVSVDTLLKLYPWPHGGLQITASACTLTILQHTIQLAVYGDCEFNPPIVDPVVLEAAKVCSAEIYKAFYYAIDTTGNKSDLTKPIKSIEIFATNYLPQKPSGQDGQVVFVFGTKVDNGLIPEALNSLGMNLSDIPDSNDEAYLLADTASKSKNRMLVVSCSRIIVTRFEE